MMICVQKGNNLAIETPTTDRRVQRTRLALRDALISLLHERSWDDINIQILCERADIGRSTFYIHFQNKEELLVSGFKDLQIFLRARAGPFQQGASDSLPFLRGLIEHVYEHRTLFRVIIGRGSGHVVQKRFREMVNQLFDEDISLDTVGWERDAVARYVAGAFIELLAWWIDVGTERSADDIENLFYQLTLPVIRSLDYRV